MKITKKLISLLIVIVILTTSAIAAFAAGEVSKVDVEAGSSKSIGFNYTKQMGVQGTITFSNPGLFVEDVSKLTTTIVGMGFYNQKTHFWAASTTTPPAGDVGINFTLTVKETANAGESCTITHTYRIVVWDPEKRKEVPSEEEFTDTITITVKAKPAEPKPTEPKPTEPKPTEPKPTEPAVKVDYTELKEQIDIASGLEQGKYTAESWQALQDALAKANSLKYSKDQAAVDAAAKALQDAIAALKEMDYSKLVAAMDKVTKLAADDELAELFRQLFEANAEGKQLLSSGDQAAVDAGAAKIEDLLAKIAAKLEELNKVEIVEVEKEVEVQVMPSDDYCNIHMHKVWPILFWISLALNLGFIALIVVYFVRKKQNQKDNTPLVDYDISDDEE